MNAADILLLIFLAIAIVLFLLIIVASQINGHSDQEGRQWVRQDGKWIRVHQEDPDE